MLQSIQNAYIWVRRVVAEFYEMMSAKASRLAQKANQSENAALGVTRYLGAFGLFLIGFLGVQAAVAAVFLAVTFPLMLFVGQPIAAGVGLVVGFLFLMAVMRNIDLLERRRHGL